MYMADYNVLKAIGKPTAEVEGVIAKLATDLNVSFVLDILKEQAPKDATKEQLQAFLNAQEDKIIEKMAAENKIDAEVEMLGAASAEYACLVANPTLVVRRRCYFCRSFYKYGKTCQHAGRGGCRFGCLLS